MRDFVISCDFLNLFCNNQLFSFYDNISQILTGWKKCHICWKSFTNQYNLDNHERIHTGDKPFKCKICNKSFAQKGHLDRHKRIHTGEKPFECDICGQKFSNSSHLKDHHKTHIGEKKFKCD